MFADQFSRRSGRAWIWGLVLAALAGIVAGTAWWHFRGARVDNAEHVKHELSPDEMALVLKMNAEGAGHMEQFEKPK